MFFYVLLHNVHKKIKKVPVCQELLELINFTFSVQYKTKLVKRR